MMKNILIALLFLSTILFGKSVQTSTDWDDFVSSEGGHWRVRFSDRKTAESLYRISGARAKNLAESPDHFLQTHSRLLGIDRLEQLRFVRQTNSASGSHFLYQQYSGELTVEGAVVAIHTDRSNHIIAANSSFQANLRSARTTIVNDAIARAAAFRFLGANAKTSEGTLVSLPLAGEAVPAWKFLVNSGKEIHKSFLVYVDASRPNIILRMLKTYTAATGEGRIYLENPVVTPDRSMQQFLYLHGEKLNGSFLKTYNANGRFDVNEFRFSDFTTASNPNLQFNFGDRDSRLAEAMAYFHINRVHDRWKQMGMTVLDSKAPVFVNVTEEDQGKGLDNAFYSRSGQFPFTGAYVFGSGDRFQNLGLDADIYYHEYGHGVLDLTRPQFLESFESNYPRAFHEGFSDISAAAITGNSKIGEYGLRYKETNDFAGRDLENANRFPQDVLDPVLKRAEIHHTGLIAGGAWWDLQKRIGVDQAQSLLFKALPLLPKEVTFFDLRDSMLVTDSVFNQSQNHQSIEDSFAEHGITDADPGQTGRLKVTALRTGLYDLQSGRTTLTNKFQKGDVIAVLADYEAENVTPGYNMIPEWISMRGPALNQFLIILLADEAVRGRHGGLKGALQVIMLTDVPAEGEYILQLQSRLGGTSKIGRVGTVCFQMN